jgi:hypothetical protein
MPKGTDVFEFDPDCDTNSVKHIMAEVEYHIMQQNKDEELHQLLQVDKTTPIDVLQPNVIEEEDRKSAAIPVTKVVDKDAIESQPDVVDIRDRKPAAIQPKPLANTVPDVDRKPAAIQLKPLANTVSDEGKKKSKQRKVLRQL